MALSLTGILKCVLRQLSILNNWLVGSHFRVSEVLAIKNIKEAQMETGTEQQPIQGKANFHGTTFAKICFRN